MSLENLQTLSKLKKICVHNFSSRKICVHNFSSRKICVQPVHKKGKKVCARILFFEFGESLERFWRFSKLILFSFFLQTNSQKKWKLTSNKHFPVSLEWVWRFSKLSPKSSPNSVQTHMFSKVYFHFFFLCFFLGGEKGSELGDSPNSLQTGSKPICVQSVFLYCFWNRSVFGVTWRLSKLSWVWNTNARTTNILFLWSRVEMFKCFHATSEWVWTFSKLSPNPFQIQVFPAILKRTKGSACAWPTAHIFVSRRRRSATLSLSKIFQISKPRTKKRGSAYAGLGPECFFE